jgi:hypothetical protein
MATTTLSPHARIGALIGVLLTVLAGSALYMLHGHSSHSTPIVTTPTVHPSQPSGPVHVVQPKVNPLFPTPVRSALERNRLVVAGFYNPASPVDSLTIKEARAGAEAAHVGFVAVNLLNDSVAGPLTSFLPANELLPNPGIVIYRRPGTLVYRSDGYLNRTAVEQAVREAQ